MADIKKTADGVDNDSPYRALEADAAQMKIEEAQGELEPGEAMTECEMEVEADMLLQAALEEKLKAEARLEAALEEKRAAEAKLQAALDENREAEARLEGAAVIRPEIVPARMVSAKTCNLLGRAVGLCRRRFFFCFAMSTTPFLIIIIYLCEYIFKTE